MCHGALLMHVTVYGAANSANSRRDLFIKEEISRQKISIVAINYEHDFREYAKKFDGSAKLPSFF